MDATPPMQSRTRRLWSTARQLRVQKDSVAAIAARLLRAAKSYAAGHQRVRKMARDLLKHTPGLRLRIKRLLIALENGSGTQRRAFGPPSVVRTSARTRAAAAESASPAPSTSSATRFTIAERMQPIVDVEDARARLRNS